MHSNLKLNSNSKIAVIGAGASGTLFSIVLKNLFKSNQQKSPEITLFDEKQIDKRGIHGCNLCAGVIQPTFLNKISQYGLTLPSELIREKIYSYKIHTELGPIELEAPNENMTPILTVFRGIGPLKAEMKSMVNFDTFLIYEAIKCGVQFKQAIINNISLPKLKFQKVNLEYYRKEQKENEEFDLCIVACGLNTELLTKLELLNFGYKKPTKVRAFQIELEINEDFYNEVKKHIHIFPIRIGSIKSGAFIPKKNFLTLSLIGEDNITIREYREFMTHRVVRNFFKDSFKERCCCQPFIALHHAVNPFTDRLLLTGDAFCCRYYKNGIESAFNTAVLAANTVYKSGFKKEEIKKFYFKKCQKEIILDNYIGKALFFIDNLILKNKFLLKVFLNIAYPKNKSSSTSSLILWQYLTGTEKFFRILLNALNVRFLISIVKGFVKFNRKEQIGDK